MQERKKSTDFGIEDSIDALNALFTVAK